VWGCGAGSRRRAILAHRRGNEGNGQTDAL